MHPEASAYLAWLRSADRSPNTEVKADPLLRRRRDTLEAQLDTPCVHEDVLP